MDVDISIGFKRLFISIAIIATILLIHGCRPPATWVKNKAKYFRSTQEKNVIQTDNQLPCGTFVARVTSIENKPLLIKFNPNQTIQLGFSPVAHPSLLSMQNDTYLQYLQNEVTYYYYFDQANQVYKLERFEYWDTPWWNFFVTPSHYMTEAFQLRNDTLVNMSQGSYTRFAAFYVLNPLLIQNFKQIHNPYLSFHNTDFPKMDSTQVIRKAKRHHAYWTEYWVSPPALSFDEKERTWTVHSVKTEHTNRGDCKNTNGCTVVKSVTLVIDDKKDKVVSKTKEKKIFPNYE
jgi:hypothetical protein